MNNDTESEPIHIPYNINNILITEYDVIEILKKQNICIDKINDMSYFVMAFTHKSYCKKSIYTEKILEEEKKIINNPKLLELFENDYGRLEYIGDRVIKLIISTYLYFRYPNQDEGFMTKLQIKLEEKNNLSYISKQLGFEKYFIISKQIEMNNGRNSNKLHEDIFESFMGALYFSNGYDICVQFLINIFETIIDFSEKIYTDTNYKDLLMKHYHQIKWASPKYVTIHEEGLSHEKKYIMCVLDNNNNKFGYGTGKTKKTGEQKAAKMALILLNVLNDNDYTSDDIFYPNI